MAFFYLFAVLLLAISGVAGIVLPDDSRLGRRLSLGLIGLGATLGTMAALRVLAAGNPLELSLRWPVPSGVFSLRLDALGAFFALPVFVVSLLGAIYADEYWTDAGTGRKLRCFYGTVGAGLALVMAAGDPITFLAAWEAVGVSAFFLVTTESHDPAVRRAGWIYVAATHTATLCLFGAFALLARAAGAWSFAPLASGIAASPLGTKIFLLALLGCGIKAGAMPGHVWLPGAHAAAPSHVSALMSGVLIKMGVYGLVRVVSLFPDPPLIWGQAIFAVGVLSAILGVAFALGQHDLKRLLAYHSIENIGIIFIGIGFAVVGQAVSRPDWIVLGYAGGLLHVWNHGLFKALLFLQAGSVIHATGTRHLERLGALAPDMPRTSLLFLIGAVAICGLPPLNGFVSEWLIYLGLFRSLGAGGSSWLLGGLGVTALALVGALALACFVKAWSAVFLGQRRCGAVGHDPGPSMLGPGLLLAAACAAIGLAPQLVGPLLDRVTRVAAGGQDLVGVESLAPLLSLSGIAVTTVLLTALAGAVAWAKTRAARTDLPTWDCGYASASARMQYGGSSIAREIVGFFRWALRPEVHSPRLGASFAPPARFASHVGETMLERVIEPVALALGRAATWARWFQLGRVQLYLAYMALTLIVLLWVR